MKKSVYSFQLGLNDQTTRQQEISTIEALKLCNRLASEKFWWCTISENNGGYKYLDGEIVQEISLKIDIVDYWSIDDKKAVQFKENLKQIFNQEDVLLSKSTIELL